jgi:chemotaxis regulatin CheY-phosphate phosphatase CheZ
VKTRTLERRLDTALDHVWIGAKLMRDGEDIVDGAERLDYIQAHLDEARELLAKIERRDARRARSAELQARYESLAGGGR